MRERRIKNVRQQTKFNGTDAWEMFFFCIFVCTYNIKHYPDH